MQSVYLSLLFKFFKNKIVVLFSTYHVLVNESKPILLPHSAVMYKIWTGYLLLNNEY